jgi:hypothetical protein
MILGAIYSLGELLDPDNQSRSSSLFLLIGDQRLTTLISQFTRNFRPLSTEHAVLLTGIFGFVIQSFLIVI